MSQNKTFVGIIGILGIWVTAGLALPFVNVLKMFTPGQLMFFRGAITAIIAFIGLRGVIGRVDKYTYLIALTLPCATLGLFEGIRHWGASPTIIVITATPIVNFVISFFLGRKISLISLIALGLVLGGVTIARWGGHFQLEGFLWTLFGTIMCGILFELFARAKANSLQKCFWAMIGMATLGLALSWNASWALVTEPKLIALLIGFAFVGGFLYWHANMLAFQNLPTAEASVLAQGETVAVIIGANLILGERLTSLQWFGVIVTLIGAVCLMRSLSKNEKKEKENNMIDAKHLVKEHAARNIPLCYDEAYALGVYLMEACHGDKLAQIQSVALLTALHNQATYAWDANGRRTEHTLPESSAEQIAGICAAIFNLDIAKSEFGFLTPNVPYAMDNCGMGGDLIVTANVSTLAAFVASAGEIPMCKHGSPANADKGRHGSSDFIDLCGINRFADKRAVQRCVEKLSFGYTEALDTRYKHIHLQTHKIAQLPHMNDIIGPITNPLSQAIMTRRVLGINHLIKPEIIAEVYKILNQKGITCLEHGLFIRGFAGDKHEGGMDELSICEPGTQVAELKNGRIEEYWLRAEDFGINPISPEFVSPPSGISKGQFSIAILERKAPFPSIQMVLANAALLFYLAERSSDLKQCYLMAEEILMSGRAYQRVSEVREMLPAR